ncbi:MAG: PKD domain-containing protein [Cyclobacteriaceae bacterium]
MHSFKIPLVLSVILFSILPVFGHNDASIHRRFIENKGQWDEKILFRAEIPNGYMFFHKGGFTYLFYDDPFAGFHHEQATNASVNTRTNELPANEIKAHAVRVTFEGSNNISFTGNGAGTERYNYFIGKNKGKWASNISAFEGVTLADIYPGIDFKFYSVEGHMKYDVIAAPGADLAAVRMKIDGADNLSIIDGELKICTSLQDISEPKPYTYQAIANGRQKEIKSRFVLEDNYLSFDVGRYDREKEIVIDPALVFSTFSGSTADNWGFTAAFDDEGHAYSGGIVRIIPGVGGLLPTSTGAFNIFHNGGTWDVALLKYDSLGETLLYGTYLGGLHNEFPHSLVVNNEGDLLIMGSTGSADFPMAGEPYDNIFNGGVNSDPLKGPVPLLNFNFGSDIFIAKLSADGSTLKASTFLGGTHNDGIGEKHTIDSGINLLDGDDLVKNYGDQFRGDIIMDSDDNIYIASNTRSTDYPLVGGFQGYAGGKRDGVITKLSADLSTIEWSTFIGGEGEDVAYSIKLLNGNKVLLSGGTNSPDFPSTTGSLNENIAGGIDGFVALIESDGSVILNSTFLGTSNDDQAYFIDFDTDESVYVFGQTQGLYTIEGNTFNNPGAGQFIHKLNSDLSQTIFSTTFGSGVTDANNLIIPDISPTAFLVSECDNFYLSGWGSPGGNFSAQNGYQGLNINGLPLSKDAFQTASNNGAFYMAVFDADATELLFGTYFGGNIAAAHVDGGTSRFDKKGIVYQSVCTCGSSQDNFPTTPGVWSNTNNAFPVPNGQGGFSPRCNNAIFKYDLATLSARIQTSSIDGDQIGISNVCLPTPILFVNQSNGGENIQWGFGDGTVIDNQDSVIHEYLAPGKYSVFLKVEDANTCEQVDVAFLTIDVEQGDFSIIDDTAICEGASIQLSAIGGDNYSWTSNLNPEVFSNEPNPEVSPTRTTEYIVESTTDDGCFWKDSVEVRVVPSVTSDFEIMKSYECMDFPTFELINQSTNNQDLIWDLGDGSTSEVENPVHQYNQNGTYTIELTTHREFCDDTKKEPVANFELFLPNVITPNNDNLNDRFAIPNDGNMQLNIVDRNGNNIFSSMDYQNDWAADGQPDGVYYYHIMMPDSTECNGLVHVIR